MNVSLTPDLEKFIQAKVNSGRYQSSSEVVREALRLLEEKDQEKQQRLEALRAEIQHALNSGDPTPLTHEDYEDVKRRGRERLKKR